MKVNCYSWTCLLFCFLAANLFAQEKATTVANMRKNKLPLLKQADEALARMRLLFRLSYEMRLINL